MTDLQIGGRTVHALDHTMVADPEQKTLDSNCSALKKTMKISLIFCARDFPD